MTGNSFGYVTPRGVIETSIALLFMVLGACFSAMIFADFESLMDLTRSAEVEKKIEYE